jgi:peptidoglycan lytic transglycosylase G
MAVNFGYEYAHGWINSRYGNYSGPGYGTVRVTVPPGSYLTQLGPKLLSAGVIMALRPYDSAANAAQNAATLQPGVYLLHSHMNAALAVAALLNPKNRVKDQITIIEGWRASQIAAALAKQTGDPASQFTQIIAHPPASLGLPKWAAGKSAEGFLFPDTYTLLPHMTPLAVLQMMVKDFNHRVESLRLPIVAPQKFVTPYQILTAASLIQAEAGSASDFGKISRVIWNRIRLHIKLGFDSTVFYAMRTYGTYLKTKQQLDFNSPYNTYQHFGLPPGPIGSPGLAAIMAALHAPRGSWLYFITDTRHKPYKTYFTTSYQQFKQWQLQFQG